MLRCPGGRNFCQGGALLAGALALINTASQASAQLSVRIGIGTVRQVTIRLPDTSFTVGVHNCWSPCVVTPPTSTTPLTATLHTQATSLTYRFYGTLMVTCSPQENICDVIVEVPLEVYVAQVLAHESRNALAPEYLKALAVVVRTYTLTHLRRHQNRGFNLCNQPHCQVFDGVPAFAWMPFLNAAVATTGWVLTDSAGNLLPVNFHACGFLVFTDSLPWGRKSTQQLNQIATIDTFSTLSPWGRWCQKTRAQPPDSSLYHWGIHSLDVRIRLGLPSAVFVCSGEQELVCCGYGKGHGAGFSQHGAHLRAMLDSFDMFSLLRWYFPGARLSHLKYFLSDTIDR